MTMCEAQVEATRRWPTMLPVADLTPNGRCAIYVPNPWAPRTSRTALGVGNTWPEAIADAAAHIVKKDGDS